MKPLYKDTEALLEGCCLSVVALAFDFLKVWIVQLLWNWLMPSVFIVLPEITYWQAFGIYFLFGLLFNENIGVVRYLREINRKIQ